MAEFVEREQDRIGVLTRNGTAFDEAWPGRDLGDVAKERVERCVETIAASTLHQIDVIERALVAAIA